jgi:hypothetical protein
MLGSLAWVLASKTPLAEGAMAQVHVRPVYQLESFCQDFAVKPSRARREIREGRLPSFRIGRFIFVAGEDALEWRDLYRDTGIVPASPSRVM